MCVCVCVCLEMPLWYVLVWSGSRSQGITVMCEFSLPIMGISVTELRSSTLSASPSIP